MDALSDLPPLECPLPCLRWRVDKKPCWLVHVSFRNTCCIVGFHSVRTCRYLEVWKSTTRQSSSSHSETLQPAISNLVYLTAICVSCQIWLRHTSGNSGWKLSQDDSSLLEEHDVGGERTRRGDLRLIPKEESAESMYVMYVSIIIPFKKQLKMIIMMDTLYFNTCKWQIFKSKNVLWSLSIHL